MIKEFITWLIWWCIKDTDKKVKITLTALIAVMYIIIMLGIVYCFDLTKYI